jgi:hypothetical protein
MKRESNVDFSCIQSRHTFAKFSGMLKNGVAMILVSMNKIPFLTKTPIHYINHRRVRNTKCVAHIPVNYFLSDILFRDR